MSLRARELVGELMDDPSLDPREHGRALRGLARLNRLSVASSPIARALNAWGGRGADGIGDLLDVASGSGDVLVGVLDRVRVGRAHACDISPVACDRIERRAAHAGREVRVFRCDAVSEGGLGACEYDAVMNALFLHHLDEGRVVALLRSMARSLRAGGVLVVSDLLRTRRGYAMALVASRAVTRSYVVHADALRSVRAAFTMDELRFLADEAGLSGARLERVWPQRALLTWEKPR
ncbi:MAG: methyltransferase domain-containing protein [Planctomycetota bacterium]